MPTMLPRGVPSLRLPGVYRLSCYPGGMPPFVIPGWYASLCATRVVYLTVCHNPGGVPHRLS